jgi:hypothetical protein
MMEVPAHRRPSGGSSLGGRPPTPRAQRIVDFLRRRGFDIAVDLDGGVEAWPSKSIRRRRVAETMQP